MDNDSGRGIIMDLYRNRLLRMLRDLSFRKRKINLTSGKESDFYFDCKNTTLTAEGHVLAGRLLFEEICFLGSYPDAVGGLELGACPLASAVAYTSILDNRPINSFIVRKEAKEHGTGRWIEGRALIPDGSKVVILEDVVTTGSSVIKAIDRCRQEKFEVIGCLALIDRLDGGRQAIEAQNVFFKSIFTYEDFFRNRLLSY